MTADSLKKQQMEYIGIGVLVLIALFVGINKFKKSEGSDEIFSRKEFKERWKEVEILESSIPREEGNVRYEAVDRIPFKSPLESMQKARVAEEEVILPTLTLHGMVWNSARPQVIINSKIYDIGDFIEIGEEVIKVIDITKEGIFLRYKGKEFIVRPK